MGPRLRHLLTVAASVGSACKPADDAPDGRVSNPTTENSTGGCGFSSADDLPEVENGIFGQEHACESDPGYDPSIPWVTIWFVGKFDIDDCDSVTGQETWKVFPNPLLVGQGMDDCEVSYPVSGTRGDPVGRGDFSLTMTATLDLDATTCAILGSQPLWKDYTAMALAYDVDVDPSGTATVYFSASGNVLGAGYGNDSHVSYLSEHDCTAYVAE